MTEPETIPRDTPDERDLADHDPVEVLRRMLAISPEDAARAREDAAKASGEVAEEDQRPMPLG